jgi:hypothetical protein
MGTTSPPVLGIRPGIVAVEPATDAGLGVSVGGFASRIGTTITAICFAGSTVASANPLLSRQAGDPTVWPESTEFGWGSPSWPLDDNAICG